MSELWLTRILISKETVWHLSHRLGDRTKSADQVLGLNAYNWHRLSWDAFPGCDGAARDFLTRLDEHAGRVRLLILSPRPTTPPQWLTQRDEWASKQIPQGFFTARSYRFQLHANPTVKRIVRNAAGERKKNGRREPITDKMEIFHWLNRKGQTGGFTVQADPLEIQAAPIRFTKKENGGTHHAVDIEGVLNITDPLLFHQETFSKGIGSAKAFGFGLLCLAPI